MRQSIFLIEFAPNYEKNDLFYQEFAQFLVIYPAKRGFFLYEYEHILRKGFLI